MTNKDWIKREVQKGYVEADVVATLSYFQNNKYKFKERDIFKYDASDLEKIIKEGNIKSSNDKKRENRGKYKIIKQTEEFVVVRPDDLTASAFWGLGTQWCITMTNAEYFHNYLDENHVFYFLIDKTKQNQNKGSKICISILKNSKNKVAKTTYFLADDTQISPSKLPVRIRRFLKLSK